MKLLAGTDDELWIVIGAGHNAIVMPIFIRDFALGGFSAWKRVVMVEETASFWAAIAFLFTSILLSLHARLTIERQHSYRSLLFTSDHMVLLVSRHFTLLLRLNFPIGENTRVTGCFALYWSTDDEEEQ